MLSLRFFFCYFVLHFLIVDPIPALTVVVDVSRCDSQLCGWRKIYKVPQLWAIQEKWRISNCSPRYVCLHVFQFHMQIRWNWDGCKGVGIFFEIFWNFLTTPWCFFMKCSTRISLQLFYYCITIVIWICKVQNYYITSCSVEIAGKLMNHCSRVMKTFCFIANT